MSTIDFKTNISSGQKRFSPNRRHFFISMIGNIFFFEKLIGDIFF